MQRTVVTRTDPHFSPLRKFSEVADGTSESSKLDTRATRNMVRTKVLHCCGSPVSKYYSMISVHYCRQMLAGASDDDTKASFDFVFAVILPGGAWCLVNDLDQATIDDADKLSHGEALTALVAGEFDVCVPHMFCWPGYTRARWKHRPGCATARATLTSWG